VVWRPLSASLADACPDEWARAISHPFVQAAADGTLPAERFHRWIRQDRLFVVALRGFIRSLSQRAPSDDRAGLEAGLAALEPELELFSAYAARERIDLHEAPAPECAAYLDFLNSTLARGYVHALAAYYACERAYLEAWTTVRATAAPDGAYAEWIGNWTSEAFGAYVGWLAERLDAIAIGLSDDDIARLRDTFRETVRHEVAFWDACFT
jgi:thiaminase/transcriptional activator TenA